MAIRPKGYRVILKPDEVNYTTPSGIVIAVDKKLEQAGQQRCTVIAVGERCWEGYDPYAEPGDWIIVSKYSGKVVEDPVNGEQFIICNDEDILAVIDRGKDNQVSDDLQSILDSYKEAA